LGEDKNPTLHTDEKQVGYRRFYSPSPECPAPEGGENPRALHETEWFLLSSPPSMGGADCRCIISYSQPGRVEKTSITPTLILPHQGGGESLVVERDAPCGSEGRVNYLFKSIFPGFPYKKLLFILKVHGFECHRIKGSSWCKAFRRKKKQ
jgi:hypothetical protein